MHIQYTAWCMLCDHTLIHACACSARRARVCDGGDAPVAAARGGRRAALASAVTFMNVFMFTIALCAEVFTNRPVCKQFTNVFVYMRSAPTLRFINWAVCKLFRNCLFTNVTSSTFYTDIYALVLRGPVVGTLLLPGSKLAVLVDCARLATL